MFSKKIVKSKFKVKLVPGHKKNQLLMVWFQSHIKLYKFMPNVGSLHIHHHLGPVLLKVLPKISQCLSIPKAVQSPLATPGSFLEIKKLQPHPTVAESESAVYQ